MPLSVDIIPIEQTAKELPGFVAWLQRLIDAARRIWTNENRRSGPAKNLERRQ